MPAHPPAFPRASRPLIALALALAAWVPLAAVAGDEPSPSNRLTLVERAVVQDQGGWRVDYRLRLEGATLVVASPAEIAARIDGWVSNSRVASHAVPRPSSLLVSGASGLSALADVIVSADEAQRCRERAVLQVWSGDDHDGPPLEPSPKGASAATATPTSPATATVTATAAERPPLLNLSPGGTVRVRLRLEHQHFLYGDFDPLLGQRTVELHLGAATFRDVVPMESEQYLAMPRFNWPAPPEERRDTRRYVSAPDSLHLEAHVPGNQYYRFPERPVRYGTKMRLRFWYLIAVGTEGECRARVAQYKDTPTAWKVLSEGAHVHCLTTVGRWVKVERVFRTEPDATTLALDFQISGADIGEMWIDDVSLEPIGAGPAGP